MNRIVTGTRQISEEFRFTFEFDLLAIMLIYLVSSEIVALNAKIMKKRRFYSIVHEPLQFWTIEFGAFR